MSGKLYVEDIRKITNIPAKGVCPWEKNVYNTNGFEVRIKTMYHINIYLFLERIVQLVGIGLFLYRQRFVSNVIFLTFQGNIWQRFI